MIVLSSPKLKNVFAGKQNFSLKKEKKKKNFFVESLDQWRRLEVREKARNVFVMSLRLSDHKVLHYIASSSSFFLFHSDFLAFFTCILYFKFLEFKDFNRTIIPFALVGYETGYSQLGTTCLVDFTITYPMRTHGITILLNIP